MLIRNSVYPNEQRFCLENDSNSRGFLCSRGERPVWCFAGGRDPAVPVERFYAGMNELERLSSADVRFTVEEDGTIQNPGSPAQDQAEDSLAQRRTGCGPQGDGRRQHQASHRHLRR